MTPTASLALLLVIPFVVLPDLCHCRLLLQVYNNTALASEPLQETTIANLDVAVHHFRPWQSVRIQALLTPLGKEEIDSSTSSSNDDWWLFQLTVDQGYARLWVDHHLLIDGWTSSTTSATQPTTPPAPIDARYALPVPSIPRKQSSLIQLELTFWNDTATTLTLNDRKDGAIPDVLFTAELPASELEYQGQRAQAETGWNTWLSGDMLSHALLPQGLTLSMAFHVPNGKNETVISNLAAPSCNLERFPVKHGLHDTRGQYTELEELYLGPNITIRVESATTTAVGLVIVLTLLTDPKDFFPHVMLDLQLKVPDDFGPRYCAPAYLEDNILVGACPGFQPIRVVRSQGSFWLGDKFVDKTTPLPLSAGNNDSFRYILQAYPDNTEPLTPKDAISTVQAARELLLRRIYKAKEHSVTMGGLVTAIAWNVIYTPYEGIVTPVFRGSPWWLAKPHDYVLFEWDTHFASVMAAYVDDHWVATNNIVRMIQTLIYQGFVPGFWNGECGELDKSKPPVGALALEILLQQFPEQEWVVDLLFDHLLDWNEWWTKHRMPVPGLVAPGSSQYNANLTIFCDIDVKPVYASKCETGLDNSPIYDASTFVDDLYVIDHVDVGMTALFILDCDILIRLATKINRLDVIPALQRQSQQSKDAMERHLWNEVEGTYVNKNWQTGEWIPRDVQTGSYPLAPTSFYPWLYGAGTADRVNRMIARYLSNSSEFGVNNEIPYGIPSISRSSSTFEEQDYWRGRIWGPMNFLVYLGLLQCPATDLVVQARKDLATQSEQTFLGPWLSHHRVMENYDSSTGVGCNGAAANPFYHWGALNALIPLLESNIVGSTSNRDATWNAEDS